MKTLQHNLFPLHNINFIFLHGMENTVPGFFLSFLQVWQKTERGFNEGKHLKCKFNWLENPVHHFFFLNTMFYRPYFFLIQFVCVCVYIILNSTFPVGPVFARIFTKISVSR